MADVGLLENLSDDERNALQEELRRLARVDAPLPPGKTVTEEKIDAYVACTDPLCPGYRQTKIRARFTVMTQTYGHRNRGQRRGGVSLEDAAYADIVENSWDYLAFINAEDVPCPVCHWPRELSRQQRPRYLRLSGHDPQRLAQEFHRVRQEVEVGDEYDSPSALVFDDTARRDAAEASVPPTGEIEPSAATESDSAPTQPGFAGAPEAPEKVPPEGDMPPNVEWRRLKNGDYRFRARGRINGSPQPVKTVWVDDRERAAEMWRELTGEREA